mmetsp:Transcript_86319/g.192968  ORF Transcript_86319/g.192968 Transcript_86319/m.192968 type:complete len:239 (+) Transcript_86319:83-799(+)
MSPLDCPFAAPLKQSLDFLSQSCVLHVSVSTRSAHGDPAFFKLRSLTLWPPPHSAVHLLHSSHSLNSQGLQACSLHTCDSTLSSHGDPFVITVRSLTLWPPPQSASHLDHAFHAPNLQGVQSWTLQDSVWMSCSFVTLQDPCLITSRALSLWPPPHTTLHSHQSFHSSKSQGGTVVVVASVVVVAGVVVVTVFSVVTTAAAALGAALDFSLSSVGSSHPSGSDPFPNQHEAPKKPQSG